MPSTTKTKAPNASSRRGRPAIPPEDKRVIQTFTLPRWMQAELRQLRGEARARINAAVERIVGRELDKVA